MKYNKISYKGKELKRISRKKVNNIINRPSKYQGLTIYTLPVETNPESPCINGFFEIEYYNCNDELGSYLKYYIEVGSDA